MKLKPMELEQESDDKTFLTHSDTSTHGHFHTLMLLLLLTHVEIAGGSKLYRSRTAQ